MVLLRNAISSLSKRYKLHAIPGNRKGCRRIRNCFLVQPILLKSGLCGCQGNPSVKCRNFVVAVMMVIPVQRLDC